MDEIKRELLDLFDNDEQYVNEFLQDVDLKNAQALLRVARSLVVSRSTETEETEEEEVGAVEEEEVVDESVEEVETEETVEEESVEENDEAGETEEEEEEAEVVEEEVEDEPEIEEVELGEEFVNDLVGSEEFRSVLANAIAEEFANFTAAFEERMRSVEEQVVEEKEWIQDVPKRTIRRVSYRPRTVNGEQGSVNNGQVKSYEDVAADTVANIFD